MGPKQIRFFKKNANLPNTVLLASLLLIMTLIIIPDAIKHIKSCGHGANIIDGLLFYSPSQVHELIGSYGAKGRQVYIAVELTADLFYSIVIAAFFNSFLIYSSSKIRNNLLKFQYYLLLPLLIIISNFLENSGIVWMLINYPTEYFYLALITSFFTLSKWLLIITCCVMAGWNLVKWYFQSYYLTT